MIKHQNHISYAVIITVSALFLLVSGCNRSQDTNGTNSTTSATQPTTVGTEVDDSIITTKVKMALMSNADINSLNIKVITHQGNVTLNGFAKNEDQIKNSTDIAKNVEGVKNVTNKLTLIKEGNTVGKKIEDSVITAQVKAALLADSMIKSLDISVVTKNGEVQLSGFVNNKAQLTRAEDVVKRVEGVQNVRSNIKVRREAKR